MQQSFFKMIFALVLGYASALGWVIYTDLVYKNYVPLDAIFVHGAYPVMLGMSAVIAAGLIDRNFSSLGINRTKGKYILLGIVFTVILVIVPMLINQMAGLFKVAPLSKLNTKLVISFPLIFIPSLCEEVMWRGIVYDTLSREYSFVKVSLITGVLWTAWHYPILIHTHFIYTDRPTAFMLIMFSLLIMMDSFIYTYLRKVSGSIWACVVLHGLCDYIAFVWISPLEVPVKNYSIYFKSDIGITYLLAAVFLSGYLAANYFNRKLILNNL